MKHAFSTPCLIIKVAIIQGIIRVDRCLNDIEFLEVKNNAI